MKSKTNTKITKLDKFIGWARSYGLWSYAFGAACCAMEWLSACSPHYDIDRFGAFIHRFSPRQADMLVVISLLLQHLQKWVTFLKQLNIFSIII